MVLVRDSQSAPPRDVVELTGVTKVHPGGVRALDSVSVGFAPGTFTAVMGPSGSGKSTLLHCAAGLDRPMLTDTGHTVVAAVASAPELEAAVATHTPDLSIVDVRLPPGFRDEGLRAALSIRRREQKTPILILSQYVERVYAAELIADGNGAVGYLLKDRVTALDEFLDAIERVAAGGTAMDPEVVRQLFVRNTDDRGIATLTAREREVLGLVAQGLSNSAICTELVLAPASVEKHISNILTKLELPPADDSHRRVRAVLAYLNQA